MGALWTLPVVVRIARVEGGRRRRFAGTEMVRDVASVRRKRYERREGRMKKEWRGMSIIGTLGEGI